MENKFTIIRDTREKDANGWRWNKSTKCDGTIDGKLDTGDYTLLGMENFVIIDRKGRVTEWAKNVFEKRFERELIRLKNDFTYSYILLEFTPADILRYPYYSGIPKDKISYVKVDGRLLMKKTMEILINSEIPILFCGNKGKEVALSLLKRANEKFYARNS